MTNTPNTITIEALLDAMAHRDPEERAKCALAWNGICYKALDPIFGFAHVTSVPGSGGLASGWYLALMRPAEEVDEDAIAAQQLADAEERMAALEEHAAPHVDTSPEAVEIWIRSEAGHSDHRVDIWPERLERGLTIKDHELARKLMLIDERRAMQEAGLWPFGQWDTATEQRKGEAWQAEMNANREDALASASQADIDAAIEHWLEWGNLPFRFRHDGTASEAEQEEAERAERREQLQGMTDDEIRRIAGDQLLSGLDKPIEIVFADSAPWTKEQHEEAQAKEQKTGRALGWEFNSEHWTAPDDARLIAHVPTLATADDLCALLQALYEQTGQRSNLTPSVGPCQRCPGCAGGYRCEEMLRSTGNGTETAADFAARRFNLLYLLNRIVGTALRVSPRL